MPIPPSGTTADTARFLEVVRAALDELLGGRSRRLLLLGSPGSGRSTALEQAASVTRESGVEIVRLDPSSRLSVMDAGSVLGTRAGTRAPLAVFVDDLDLCAPSIRVATWALPGRLERPVLWIAVASPQEVDDNTPVAQRAARSPGDIGHATPEAPLEVIRLGDLSAHDILRIAAAHGAGEHASGGRLAAALSRIRPRPLEATRTIERWRQDPTAPAEDLAWPSGVIGRLDDDHAHVLGTAALLDGDVSASAVADLLGRPIGAVLPALRAAWMCGVLIEQDGTMRFAHVVMRQAMIATSPPTAADYPRAASLLVRRGADAFQLMNLVRTAASSGVHLDRHLLAQLAGVVARTDVEAAARIAHTACDALQPGDPALDEAIAHVISYLGQSGRLDLAYETLARGRADAGPAARFAFAALITSSHHRLAEEIVAQATDSTQLRRVQRARLNAVRSVALAMTDGAPRRSDFLAREAIRSGDPEAAAVARLGAALAAYARAEWSTSLALASLASERTIETPVSPSYWNAATMRAKLLNDMGRADEATALIDDLLVSAERSGRFWVLPPMLDVRAMAHLVAGELTSAERLAAAAVRLATAFGVPGLAWFNAAKVLMQVHRYRGDLTAAAELRSTIERLAGTGISTSMVASDAVLIAADLAGDDDGVRRASSWLVDDAQGIARVALANDIGEEMDRIRILIRYGLRDRVDAAAARIERIAATDGPELASAAVQHIAGVFEEDAARLHSAAQVYARHARPALSAAVHEDLAEAEVRLGDVDAAVRSLWAAHGRWTGMSATREAARVERRLRDLGSRSVTEASPVGIGFGFTGAEERVVLELIKGKSNAEIGATLLVSPHTVAVHLRRVYAKLGVASRRQAVETVTNRRSPSRVESSAPTG